MTTPPLLSPDVAIVGGGVAGSALAIALRLQGLDIVLIERSEQFRDRIRGETIHPWGTNELRRLDLYDLALDRAQAQPQIFWQKFQDRVAQTPYRWADDYPDIPNGLGVGHVALQNTLLDEASRLGVTVVRPAGATLERVAGRITVVVSSASGETTIRPKLVVGADGQKSATRTWMGGAMTSDPTHHHLGGVLIRGLGLKVDRVHQAYFEGGFVFVSPQADNVARLYLVCGTPEAMEIQKSTDTAGRIVERFRQSLPDGFIGKDWQSAGPAGFFSNATASASIPHSSDVVLIGDASGRNDPSQGHGLSLVFHDVRILSGMLVETSDWSEAPDRFHDRKRRYFETLRQFGHWNDRQATETGPEIDALKDRIARSREIDPSAGGFAGILATGPDDLSPTEAARRHYLGEELTADELVSA